MGKVIWCDRGWMPTYYGFCPSARAWKSEMKRLKIENPSAYPQTDARATVFRVAGKIMVIVTVHERIDRKRDRLGTIALIVHEAMHVWQHIRRDIGEAAPSEEFEAYALQNIVTELCAAYSKNRKNLA